jgi:hypothetical protein
VAAEILDQLARVAAHLVRRRVDVDVRVLGREGDHLGHPRDADVTPDDLQVRELERDVVQVGNGAARLRRTERPGVTDLQAEGDAELGALGVEPVVAAVVGREVPEPGQDAQRPEAELAHAAPELAHRVHRAVEIDRADAHQAARVGTHVCRHLVVGDERALRPPPRGH